MQILHRFAGSIRRYSEEVSDPNRYRPDHCPQCEAHRPPGEGGFGQPPGRLAMVKLQRIRRHERRRIRQPTDGLIVDRVRMPSDPRARI